MMNETIPITSSDKLEDIDHHFRVFAGPGAGKTYWLKNHIDNVLRNSDRISSVSKIACITYTVVASEQIKKRLGKSADKVEISTIHSFLYKNVIKPYAFLLTDEDGNYLIDLNRLDGHDEHVPSIAKIKYWIKENNLNYLISKIQSWSELYSLISKYMAQLDWKLDSESGEIELNCRSGYHNFTFKEGTGFYFPNDYTYKYKELYWQEGQIHHEDVLYFTYKILVENPRICDFLQCKFPYIFLDEFQDTNPIQTQIVKMLANAGCVIGVIGDPAQAIYKFQGAERKDFLDFELDGLVDYKIEGNRRSTSNIIKLLNHMRKNDEIQQICFRDEIGTEVCIIINDNLSNIHQFIDDDLSKIGFRGNHYTLARKNESVAILKSKSEKCNSAIWDDFGGIDHNRKKFYYNLSIAIEYAFQKHYGLANQQLLKIFKTDPDGNLKLNNLKGIIKPNLLQKEGFVICFLQHIIDARDSMLKSTLYEINNDILGPILRTYFDIRLTRLLRGKPKEFCESITYNDLIQNLKLSEDTSLTRTIHKSKGAEFDSVSVHLNDESDLNCVLKPDLDTEIHRIFYVAFSRAENHLYISVPSLSSENEERIKTMDINVKLIR